MGGGKYILLYHLKSGHTAGEFRIFPDFMTLFFGFKNLMMDGLVFVTLFSFFL